MKFSRSTAQYLKDRKAVLELTSYKIININFDEFEAFVNKVDTYRCPNRKIIKIEHHFGRWVKFPKSFVRYNTHHKTGITDDWCVGDCEEYQYEVKSKYINKPNLEQIVAAYLGNYSMTNEWFFEDQLTPNELNSINIRCMMDNEKTYLIHLPNV